MSQNKPVIIVSGGSKGLGHGIVLNLLEQGYYVETFSRTTTNNIAQIQNGPFATHFCWHCVDGADLSSINAFYEKINDKHPILYALINNAAVAVEGLLSLSLPEEIEAMINLNLTGTIHLTRLMSKIMLKQQDSIIINISSITGVRGYSGLSTYSATKAGLDGFTRALARELGPRGVRVNSICPGYMDTQMSESLSDEQLRKIIKHTPLGRLATVDDVTHIVEFLLSAKAKFMTGQTWVVDGGMTC